MKTQEQGLNLSGLEDHPGTLAILGQLSSPSRWIWDSFKHTNWCGIGKKHSHPVLALWLYGVAPKAHLAPRSLDLGKRKVSLKLFPALRLPWVGSGPL